MRGAAFLLGLLLSPPLLAELQPFSSDGCSLFPDGWPHQRDLWCNCCLEHDIAYWRGGSQQQRRLADQALADCVERKTGNRQLADLMYNGVRFGGHPIFPNWYRWGYGWPYGRGYQTLNDSERRSADALLKAYLENPAPYQCQAVGPDR